MDGYLPALNGEIAFAITEGFALRPGIGGIGAISLIGSYSYLPLSLFGAAGFKNSSHGFGAGARLQLLAESFDVPAIFVSVSRRTNDEIQIGDICPHPPPGLPTRPWELTDRYCEPVINGSEVSFDLKNWSTRVGIGKHFRGTGVSAGIGHDRYKSKARRGEVTDFGYPGRPIEYLELGPGDEISSSRWTAFGGVSYPFLVGSVGLEAGWQQGEPPVDGFDQTKSSYDPRKGTWYGSLSARIAL